MSKRRTKVRQITFLWSVLGFNKTINLGGIRFGEKKILQEMSAAVDNAPFDLSISSRAKYRLYQSAPLMVPQMILWP